MRRVARWRVWLASLVAGGPRWTGYAPPRRIAVFSASTPWWRRQWYRLRPPAASPIVAPSPEQIQQYLKWVHPPPDEAGAGVTGVQRVLVESESTAIVVTYCVAYSNGFQLGVGIRYRSEPKQPRGPHDFPERSLVVGVRFADGRESRWGSIRFGEEPLDPAGPFIGPTSGGGGGMRWDQNYWVVPLPPDGPLTITSHWPEGGVPDGSTELDGAAIRLAGESSQRLWTD